MFKYFSVTFLTLIIFPVSAQETDFTLSGYTDFYYAYDFNKPANREKQYVTQAARHNELNINLAMIKASLSKENLRANVALQTGTYPSVNYAAEPNDLARLINEANVGFKVGKFWIDAGVMGGHFGYESVFSLDNETYTQALATEYTPYFQTGIMISSEVMDGLLVKAVVLNGWQNIYETNDAKAFGLGATYQLNERIEVSYGNYFGDEGNDITGKKIRIHNNAYVSYNADTWKSTAILDITNQELLGSDDRGTTYMFTWTNHVYVTEQLGVGARYEFVGDPDEILFSTLAPGFHTNIITASLNYYPVQDMAVKFEAKSYYGEEEIWTTGDDITSSTFMINFGIAGRF